MTINWCSQILSIYLWVFFIVKARAERNCSNLKYVTKSYIFAYMNFTFYDSKFDLFPRLSNVLYITTLYTAISRQSRAKWIDFRWPLLVFMDNFQIQFYATTFIIQDIIVSIFFSCLDNNEYNSIIRLFKTTVSIWS
jgi:hypothetical protein